MPALASKMDPRSAAFAANAARMQQRLDEVRALEARVVAESASKREKFDKRGQLLPRERVARLIDRGSAFMELSPLAGLGMHDDDGRKSVLGGGSIVGIGIVAGKRVLVSASDSAVTGGTVAPMGLKKALRAQQLAREFSSMAGGPSPTRRGCRPPAFRRSPWCTARPPPAAPTCPV